MERTFAAETVELLPSREALQTFVNSFNTITNNITATVNAANTAVSNSSGAATAAQVITLNAH
jgi:hypothetical protein